MAGETYGHRGRLRQRRSIAVLEQASWWSPAKKHVWAPLALVGGDEAANLNTHRPARATLFPLLLRPLTARRAAEPPIDVQRADHHLINLHSCLTSSHGITGRRQCSPKEWMIPPEHPHVCCCPSGHVGWVDPLQDFRVPTERAAGPSRARGAARRRGASAPTGGPRGRGVGAVVECREAVGRASPLLSFNSE
jgi:hypothetical protein